MINLHLIVFSLAMSLTLLPSSVKAETLSENALKAAYLYNFALLNQWPTSHANVNTVQYCFYGSQSSDPVGLLLQSKKINNKPIEIKQIGLRDDLGDCHLLVIQKSNPYQLAQLLDQVNGQPILTVIDTQQSQFEPNAMINLIEYNQRLGFEVNLSAVKQANMNLSSRLLRVAKKVVE